MCLGVAGTTSRFKIPLEQESFWAKILANSHGGATFAYITMEYFEMVESKCSGTAEACHNIYLLETTVTLTGKAELSHWWSLQHEKLCLFSKQDGM